VRAKAVVVDQRVHSGLLGGDIAFFTAAAWAASSYGQQPWRFLVGRKGDETYAKIFDSLMEFNQGWAKAAALPLR